MKKMRLVSSILAGSMLISALPLQTLAYFQSDENGRITKAGDLTIPIRGDDGAQTLDYDRSWDELYPYGAFVFGNYEAAINEDPADGHNTVTIPVYRLGGTTGRAEVTVRYAPAVSEDGENSLTYAYAASGKNDLTISYENPQPIAEYQKPGLPMVYSGCGITTTPEADDNGRETGYMLLTIDEAEKATSCQWQFISFDEDENGDITVINDWTDISDTLTPTAKVDYDTFYSSTPYYDYRCIYTIDGKTYCSVTAFGAEFVETDYEVPEMPDDIESEVDPTYTELVFDEDYGATEFTLVFAEDEWVKNIIVTAVDDDIPELPEIGLFTLVSNFGGDIYHAAATLSLLINDNDPHEPSEIGFTVGEISTDQDAGSVSVTVKRTGGLTYPVSVKYSTVDGTAAAGKQYGTRNGTLLFAGDTDEATIVIPLIADEARDEELEFSIALTDLAGGTLDELCSFGEFTEVKVKLKSSGIKRELGDGLNLESLIAAGSGDDISSNVDKSAPLVEPSETHTGEQVIGDNESIIGVYHENDPFTRSYSYPEGISFRRSNYSDSTKFWRNYEVAVGNTTGERVSSMSLFTKFEKPDFTDNNNTIATQKSIFESTQSRVRLQHNHSSTETMGLFPNAGLLYSNVSWTMNLYTIGIAKAGRKENEYLYVMPYGLARYTDTAGKRQSPSWNASAKEYFSDSTSIDRYWFGSVNLGLKNEDFTLAMSLSLNRNHEDYVNDSNKSLSDNDKKSGANGSSDLRLTSLVFQRRVFENTSTIGLTIHTANDADIGLGSQFGILSKDSDIYKSLRPEISIVENAGGVTTSGNLYVGSKLKLDFSKLANYSLTNDFDPMFSFYLTAKYPDGTKKDIHTKFTTADGSDASLVTRSGNICYMTLLWSDMTEEDLKAEYTINVVMERKQEVIVDVSTSVVNGNTGAAWDLFSQKKVYGYIVSETTKDGTHFDTPTSLSSKFYSTPDKNSPQLKLGDFTNLQCVNFGQDADDVILFNGRSYRGNEDIYLTQADFSSKKLIFYFYDSTCLDNQSDMNITIANSALYFDGNGNGVIDGYFNDDGFFVLDESSGDISLGFIEGDFDEKIFQPVVDENGKVHQYFLKVFYNTSPRSLKAPAGALMDDTTRVLPFFASSITGDTSYSNLSREQKSYRYVIAGYIRNADGVDYHDSSDWHPMYGAAASKLSMIDIPLGGDVSPAYKDDKGVWQWTPNYWGQLLFPFTSPAPISHNMNMTGDTVQIAGEEPRWALDTNTGLRKLMLTPFGAAKVNGYLASLVANTTYGLAVCEEPYEYVDGTRVKHKLASLSDIKPESLAIGKVSAKPNADYLSVMSGDSSQQQSGDTGGESSLPEFETDLGITLPSTEFELSDYAKIIMDGNKVGFAIGIPIMKIEGKKPGDANDTSGTGTTTAPTTPPSGNPNDNTSGGGTTATTPSTPSVPTTNTPGTSSGGTGSGGAGTGGSGSGGSGSGAGTGGTTPTPSEPSMSQPFKDANEAMSTLMDFIDKRGENFKDFFSDGYNEAQKGAGIKSKSVEASFSVALAIMFEYNPIDNAYYFKSATIAATVGLQFTLQYRFTFFPLLYVYLKTGFEISIGTGLSVARVGKEGKDAECITNNTLFDHTPAFSFSKVGQTLKEGESVILRVKLGENTDTNNNKYKVTGLHLVMNGSFYMEALEAETDAEKQKVGKYMANPTKYDGEFFSTGRLDSAGSDPVKVYFPKHSGEIIVILTALDENASIVSAKEVNGARSQVYWNGFNISPSGYIEVGVGIGIEILKAEIYIKVALGLSFSIGHYNVDKLKYEGGSFDSFSLSAAIGFRVTVLFFNYSMDLLGYYLSYEKGSGWESKFGALSNAVTLRSIGGGNTIVDVTSPTDNSRTQTFYGGEILTRSYDPEIENPHFQLSGYGKSGNGFKLVDGLSVGYSYKVYAVGTDNYMLYTISRDGGSDTDKPMLVLSEVDLNSSEDITKQRLSNPFDATENYLVIDNDQTGDLDYEAAVDGNTLMVTWVSYASESQDQTDSAQATIDASKNTVVKQVTVDFDTKTKSEPVVVSDTPDDATAPNTNFRFLPAVEGGVNFYGETNGTTTVSDQNAALKKYLELTNKLYDINGSETNSLDNIDKTSPMNATVLYRWKYQQTLNALYGDGSVIKAVNGGNTSQLALTAGQTLDTLETSTVGNDILVAYTTSQKAYYKKGGSVTDINSIDKETELVTIKRLFLVKYNTTSGFDTPKTIQTVIDFDGFTSQTSNRDYMQDGVYVSGKLDEVSIDPFFSNLRFTNANYNGSNPETLFTFEMNGNTYLVRESDLKSLDSTNSLTLIPFFNVQTQTGTLTQGDVSANSGEGGNVVIGSDDDGNLAAVYTAAVGSTVNNALMVVWWDAVNSKWGSPNILAMNHLQVLEDGTKYKLSDEELENAFLGRATGNDAYDAYIRTAKDRAKGGMDQFTFSNLSMTLVTTPVENSETSKTKQQLVVFTEGSYRQLRENSYSVEMNDKSTKKIDTLTPVDNNSADVGFYAVAFGAGKQDADLASLSFVDYRFTTGSKLSGTLEFSNTGSAAIRASASEPATVKLLAGETTVAEWKLTENVRSGEKVSLSFTMEKGLSGDLEVGTKFTATISEDKDYVGTANAFEKTLELFTVESKPELGIEDTTFEVTSVTNGMANVKLDMLVTNRGSNQADNAFVQFSYEAETTKDGISIWKPIDISGSQITIGEAELIPTRSAARSTGNSVTTSFDLDSGNQRHITGTLAIPLTCFVNGSLKLRAEVFSGSNYTDGSGLYISDHSDEYSSINNVRYEDIPAITFFSAPSSISVARGSTMRLPISISSTASNPNISVIEIGDGTENWTSNLGILYYDDTENSQYIVLAPSSEGSGVIQLKDSATGSIHAIAYKSTAAGSGINIFNDNDSFTFSDGWDFVQNIGSTWSGETDSRLAPPMNNDFVRATKNGATVSFDSVADKITLWFVGDVTITTDLNDTTVTANANVLKNSGKYPLTVDFGNTTGKTHRITISANVGTQLDRYTEIYGEHVDPVPSSEGSPNFIWSRSFPLTGSLTPDEPITIICYVTDDSGLKDVTVNGEYATKGQETIHSKNFWSVPVTISKNGSFTLTATDTAGNVTRETYNVQWFLENSSTTDPAVPAFGPDNVKLVKEDGTEITKDTPMLGVGEKASISVDYTLGENESLSVDGSAANTPFSITSNGFYTVRVTNNTNNTWSQVVVQMDKFNPNDLQYQVAVDPETKTITVTIDSKNGIKSVTLNGTPMTGENGVYKANYTTSGKYTLTITDNNNKVTVYEFEIQRTVDKLEVLTDLKLLCGMGEALDLSGLELKATWSDNTEEVVNKDTAGLTVSGFNPTQIGIRKLTVTYGGKSVELEYEIRFRGYVVLDNVGVGAKGTGDYLTKEIVELDPGKREGYAFVGWTAVNANVDKMATNFTMPDLSSLSDPTIYLTANWLKESTVTIIDGGRNSYGEGVYKVGDIVNVYAGEKGLSFLVWRSDDINIPEGTGKSYSFMMPDHDVTLTALWFGMIFNFRTVTFVTNGGSAVEPLETTDGKIIDLSRYTTNRAGYEFTGWYRDAALTEKLEKLYVRGDTTLYAGWRAVPTEPVRLPFTDVSESDWFYDDVAYVYAKGMMNGTSATTFSPELTTSRAMIVTILYRLEGSPKVTESGSFTDIVSGSWYENAVIWASENGIVNGYGGGLFGPDDTITREQFATILYRYAAFKGLDTAFDADALNGFTDAGEISSYALEPMKWAITKKLINGIGGGLLDPKGSAKRSQAAAIFHRFS